MSDLQQILSNIQKKLVAPKNQLNKFGGYNYRSCEDILEALKKVLPEGVVIAITDNITMVGDRYYVKATASIMQGVECIKATAYAREPLEKKGSDASQLTGAASSYARKYALNGLFLIDDSKDDDSTNEHDKAPPKEAPNKMPLASDMANIIIGLHRENNMLDGCEYWGKTTANQKREIWANLNQDQRDWVTQIMKNAPKA